MILPGKWVYGGEVLGTLDLFDGEPFDIGDVVKLETLLLKLDKGDHIVTSYLVLSISVGDKVATALLPFNVEPVE